MLYLTLLILYHVANDVLSCCCELGWWEVGLRALRIDFRVGVDRTTLANAAGFNDLGEGGMRSLRPAYSTLCTFFF